MKRRAVGWFAVSLIGGTIIVVSLLAISQTDLGADLLDSDSSGLSSDISGEPLLSNHSDRIDESTADGTKADSPTRDLSYHCPSVEGDLTDDCLDALAHRFGPELTQSAPLVPVCDQPTWSQVFDDPVGKRAAVISALSRDECRSEKNEIRSNADCASNAFAELAILHHKCTEENDFRDGSKFTSATLSERLDNIEAEDVNEYREKRQREREDYYRERWIAAECGLIGESVFSDIEELDGIYTGYGTYWFSFTRSEGEVIADEAVKGPIWEEKEQLRVRNQGNTLLAAAARLGNFWALSEYGEFHWFLDDLFALNPTQALIHQGDERSNDLSYEFDDAREQREENLRKRLEEVSPGIMERIESADLGSIFSIDFEKNLKNWIASQGPVVKELYEDFERTENEIAEKNDLAEQSVRRTHVHAALLHMQRQGIRYNEEAVPEWAVEVSDGELAQAHEIVAWLDEKHPDARQSADPGSIETCRSGALDPASDSPEGKSPEPEGEPEHGSD